MGLENRQDAVVRLISRMIIVVPCGRVTALQSGNRYYSHLHLGVSIPSIDVITANQTLQAYVVSIHLASSSIHLLAIVISNAH